jgi:predicted dehydrogenase
MAEHQIVPQLNNVRPPVLRVGIIGCGEIAQVAHIPTINFLAHLFQTTYLCDVSMNALAHCAVKVQVGNTPLRTTTDPKELCASPDVDVVLIASIDAYHVEHGILALENDKYCLIEKPAALCFRDIDRLMEAEQFSQGKIFVGTMRRFAPAFLSAVHEVGGMDQIQYARVRDIIGPNSFFVEQSGTYPRRFNDISEDDILDRQKREVDMVQQALGEEFNIPVTPEAQRMLRLLGG